MSWMFIISKHTRTHAEEYRQSLTIYRWYRR